MRDFFLLLLLSAVSAYGWYLMGKLDIILEENRKAQTDQAVIFLPEQADIPEDKNYHGMRAAQPQKALSDMGDKENIQWNCQNGIRIRQCVRSVRIHQKEN